MTRTYADGLEDAARVDLKPCPFCGGENVKTFGPYGWYSQWGISHSCKSFYNGSQEMFQGFSREADAAAAWNTRTLSPSPSGIEDAREARFRALFKATWDYCLSYLADEYDQPDFCGIDEKQHDALSAVFHALEDVKDTLCESASSKIGEEK